MLVAVDLALPPPLKFDCLFEIPSVLVVIEGTGRSVIATPFSFPGDFAGSFGLSFFVEVYHCIPVSIQVSTADMLSEVLRPGEAKA
jgi:hypothetical protein